MRRILVTGANKGIGLAIATAILEQHADTFVLLGSRDPDRGREAITRLIAEHPAFADRVSPLELDVASDASVARAAQALADSLGRAPAPLYALVNNAGIGFGAGGVAAVLAVNILGMGRACEAAARRGGRAHRQHRLCRGAELRPTLQPRATALLPRPRDRVACAAGADRRVHRDRRRRARLRRARPLRRRALRPLQGLREQLHHAPRARA